MNENTLRILLLEDNLGDSNLLQHILREAVPTRFVFTVATRLEEGLTRIEAQPFDAVLLDLGLPDSQGIETFFKVHAKAPHLPIVLLTGLDDEELALRVLKEGAQDYLVKNHLRADLLVRAIRYAIERKHGEEEIRALNASLEQRVTERTMALEASQHRYHTLAAVSPVGIFHTDASGYCTYVNDRWRQITGRTQEWVSEHGWLRAVHPEDEDRVREAWKRAVADFRLFHLEHRFQLPNGMATWVLAQAAPELDARQQLVGYVGIVTDISERVRSEIRLKESFHKLRSLASRLQTVREEERTEISRELHDSLGQALTALSFDLSWLEAKLPPEVPSLMERCRAMQGVVEDILHVTQRLCTEMRPLLLDDVGLAAAIEWQVHEFESRTHIACRFHKFDEGKSISQKPATAAFRVLQEALTNVVRHAQATAVEVGLQREGSTLVLTVSDNGKGITDADLNRVASIGILGMKERALAVGGELSIKGSPGKGTTVTLKIPCGEG